MVASCSTQEILFLPCLTAAIATAMAQLLVSRIAV